MPREGELSHLTPEECRGPYIPKFLTEKPYIPAVAREDGLYMPKFLEPPPELLSVQKILAETPIPPLLIRRATLTDRTRTRATFMEVWMMDGGKLKVHFTKPPCFPKRKCHAFTTQKRKKPPHPPQIPPSRWDGTASSDPASFPIPEFDNPGEQWGGGPLPLLSNFDMEDHLQRWYANKEPQTQTLYIRARDEIYHLTKQLPKDGNFPAIVNTDHSGSRGIHWLFAIITPKNRTITLFEPYGRDCLLSTTNKTIDEVRSCGWTPILHRTGHQTKTDTSSCGYHCLHWAKQYLEAGPFWPTEPMTAQQKEAIAAEIAGHKRATSDKEPTTRNKARRDVVLQS